jgi:hypothetical protein
MTTTLADIPYEVLTGPVLQSLDIEGTNFVRFHLQMFILKQISSIWEQQIGISKQLP